MKKIDFFFYFVINYIIGYYNMATNNFNAQDLSGHVFRPIRSSRPHYNSAKVAPVTSYNEACVAPQATYQQVSMYDRWADDIKSVKKDPCAQVALNERWMHDSVG